MTDETRNDADETVARIDAALAGMPDGLWEVLIDYDEDMFFGWCYDENQRRIELRGTAADGLSAAPSLLRDARAVIVAQQAELREAVVRLRFMRARNEACIESFAPDPPFDAGAWRRVELGTATREDYDALYATLKELDDDDE